MLDCDVPANDLSFVNSIQLDVEEVAKKHGPDNAMKYLLFE